MVANFTYDKYTVQCVGIDIAKDKFSACLFTYDTASDLGWWTDVIEFRNNKTGFNQLVRWSRKNSNKDYQIRYLMEPTSTYHEALAYHLHSLKNPVYLIFPAKAKEFAKYQGIKTKTDEIDARTLSTIGAIDRKLKTWTPPKPIYRTLKQMCRFNMRMERIRTELNNQLSALKAGANAESSLIANYTALICELDKQQEKNKALIKKTVDTDLDLSAKVDRIVTIKGVGYLTAVSVIAETDGFSLIENRKQLASFAGLDVMAYMSGTIDICHRITKKGNSYIRAALYWPAISASMHNAQMKELYNRVASKNTKTKMIAITAVMRKLLLLIFTLWKSGEEYDPKRSITCTDNGILPPGSTDKEGRLLVYVPGMSLDDFGQSIPKDFNPENPPF